MSFFRQIFKGQSAALPNAVNAHGQSDYLAEQLLQEGREHEQADDFDAALRCYDAAIGLMPKLAKAHFLRGQLFQSRGDPSMALAAYDCALRYKPDSAVAHYNRGHTLFDLDQKDAAIAAYKQAVAMKPDFADALVALGMTLKDLNRPGEAVLHYRQALEIKPDYLEVYFDLGAALVSLGQIEEAVLTYQRGLEFNPKAVELHGNLANALHRLKQFDSAIASYGIVLNANPRDAKAHNNLGNVFAEIGRAEEAKASYQRALTLEPAFAMPHYNLGVLIQKSGAFDQALESYHRALAIDPNYAEALVGQGEILLELGQYDSARTSCLRALEMQPEYVFGYIVLGNIQQALGRMTEALSHYEQALQIKPDYAQGHNSLGAIMAELGRLDEGEMSYRRALTLEPDNTNVLMNLGSLLADKGEFEEAIVYLERSLKIKPRNPLTLSNLLFVCNYRDDQHATAMPRYAKEYGATVSGNANPYSTWACLPNANKTLRVGVVSADLCNHPVGYFIEGVLNAISSSDSNPLEILAYITREKDDETSRSIKSRCQSWYLTAGHSDELLARRIFEDQIDILIDLSGHTAHNRLPVFAWKPAPVQVSWLGYFATTGVKEIDYVIADPWTLPEDEADQFTEQVWRLPETRLCFTPPHIQVDVGPLPALTNGYVTFGCFNKSAKINDAVVALWAQILIAVPRSRLLLMSAPFGYPSTKERFKARFLAHGIDPSRLVLEGSVPRAEYLAAYNRVDIALDPFPFTGGTTTAESLWMGVPVLTLAGRQFVARQGVGLLTNAGLPDWIASDAEDYAARAVLHASDVPHLTKLRAALRSQVLASPVFDAKRFATHFQIALRDMWQAWCKQTAASSTRH